MLRHPEGSGRRAAPSWRLKEPVEAVWASDQDAFRGVLYMYISARDSPEGFQILPGPGCT